MAQGHVSKEKKGKEGGRRGFEGKKTLGGLLETLNHPPLYRTSIEEGKKRGEGRTCPK